MESRIDILINQIACANRRAVARKLANVLLRKSLEEICALAQKTKTSRKKLRRVLSRNQQIRGLDFISYDKVAEEIKNFQETKTNCSDSSVRRTFMDLGKIDSRAACFYPGASLNGFSKKSWPEICNALYLAFLADRVICTESGQQAYYWYDVLKIFSHYLDLVFAAQNGKESDVGEILACEDVINILPYYIPIGWSLNRSFRLTVLCK